MTEPGFDNGDRTSIELPAAQREILKALHEAGKKVVLVNCSGSAVALTPELETCDAILQAWYPGEQGGEALASVLLGEVNPSGKLNYSFPQSVGHLPCFYNYLPTDKGFYHVPGSPEKPGKDYVFSSPRPLWAFGHGLSYTEFEYLSAVTSKDDYGPMR